MRSLKIMAVCTSVFCALTVLGMVLLLGWALSKHDTDWWLLSIGFVALGYAVYCTVNQIKGVVGLLRGEVDE